MSLDRLAVPMRDIVDRAAAIVLLPGVRAAGRPRQPNCRALRIRS
jgi:hypothetical protein